MQSLCPVLSRWRIWCTSFGSCTAATTCGWCTPPTTTGNNLITMTTMMAVEGYTWGIQAEDDEKGFMSSSTLQWSRSQSQVDKRNDGASSVEVLALCSWSISFLCLMLFIVTLSKILIIIQQWTQEHVVVSTKSILLDQQIFPFFMEINIPVRTCVLLLKKHHATPDKQVQQRCGDILISNVQPFQGVQGLSCYNICFDGPIPNTPHSIPTYLVCPQW